VLFWLGTAAAVAIVAISIVVRSAPPADPAAEVGAQRAAVVRFHQLVRDARWADVYVSMTEPPTKTPEAFAKLMRTQARTHGAVTAVRIESLRLLRSRTMPLLEVRETVTTSKNGERPVLSYYARTDGRWLFAFSAPE
jgi:hypothetical protein